MADMTVTSFASPLGVMSATGILLGGSSFLYTNKKMVEIKSNLDSVDQKIEKVVAHVKTMSMQPVHRLDSQVKDIQKLQENTRIMVSNLNAHMGTLIHQMSIHSFKQDAIIKQLQKLDPNFVIAQPEHQTNLQNRVHSISRQKIPHSLPVINQTTRHRSHKKHLPKMVEVDETSQFSPSSPLNSEDEEDEEDAIDAITRLALSE